MLQSNIGTFHYEMQNNRNFALRNSCTNTSPVTKNHPCCYDYSSEFNTVPFATYTSERLLIGSHSIGENLIKLEPQIQLEDRWNLKEFQVQSGGGVGVKKEDPTTIGDQAFYDIKTSAAIEKKSRRAENVAMKRANETPEQRLRKNADRAAYRRSMESAEEAALRRFKNAQRNSLRRRLETEEQKERRRKLNAERQARRRRNETVEEKEMRRLRDLMRARKRRSMETDEEKKLRRLGNATRAEIRRQNESEEEKKMRRMNNAARAEMRRQNESEEDKKLRKLKDAARAENRRQNESEEEKFMRKLKDAVRISNKRTCGGDPQDVATTKKNFKLQKHQFEYNNPHNSITTYQNLDNVMNVNLFHNLGMITRPHEYIYAKEISHEERKLLGEHLICRNFECNQFQNTNSLNSYTTTSEDSSESYSNDNRNKLISL